MDKIAHYKQLVKQEFEYYARIPSINLPDIDSQLVINEDLTHFILLKVGWHDTHYIHGLVFNVEIKDDKIWVHEDMTDYDIGWNLVEKGVPQADVILGYAPDYERMRAG